MRFFKKLERFWFLQGWLCRNFRSFSIGFFAYCFGDATKTIKYLENKSKEYVFEVEWGVKTNSADIEGKIEKTCEIFPNKKMINNSILKFKGNIYKNHKSFHQKK